MNSTYLARGLAGLAALATIAGAGTSMAQARAAAAPAAAGGGITVSGPVIAGVCIFNNERAYQTSTVGKYVMGKMQGFAASVQTELTPEKNAIQTEDKAIAATHASLSQDVLNQRVTALRQRAAGLEQKAQVRNRELELTQQKAMQRMDTEMQPLLAQVYTARNCGLLLDRSAVIAGNAQMDITDQVVQALNGKISTFPLEIEHIAIPGQQPAAGAPTRK